MKNRTSAAFFTTALLAGAALLGGCSKSEPESGTAPAAATVAATQEIATPVPAAKKMVALERYVEVDGKAVLDAVFAFAGGEPDYAAYADATSAEYRAERDVFKKKDILETLKPSIDAALAKARENPYFAITDEIKISDYSFDTKSFRIARYADAGNALRYEEGGHYFDLRFINGPQFKDLLVEDEQVARAIQAARNPGTGAIPTKSFVVVTGASGTVAQSDVVKVQILDAKGAVLFEM